MEVGIAILDKECEILRKAGFTEDELNQTPNDIIRIAEEITTKGMTRKDFDYLFEATRTRAVEETEQIELSLLEDEFLDEFRQDNRRK